MSTQPEPQTDDVPTLQDVARELDRVDGNTNAAWAKIEALAQRVEDLETTVENLQAQLEVVADRAPEPGKKEYAAMDRSDKATVVRSKLKDEATSTNGKAAVTYKDVIRMFDGRPSAGHAYDVMKTAAEADGYGYGTSPDGTNRLTYDHRTATTDGVNDRG